MLWEVREGGSNGGCCCTVVIEEGLRWVRVGEEHGAWRKRVQNVSKFMSIFFLWMQRVKTTSYKEVEESGTTPYKGMDVTGENYSFVRK